MKYSRTLTLTCLIILGLVPTYGLAQDTLVPQLINYQGSLTGSHGKRLPTAEYTLSFSIYDDPVAAPCSLTTDTKCARRVWGPQVFDGMSNTIGHGTTVHIVKGFFNVLLGPHDTNGHPISRAFTSSQRFVEVTINDNPPITPRHQVFSAPYALTSPGDVPVGTITIFYGGANNLPAHWRICNGDLVTDAASPFNGTAVPDLRGRFVRGAEATERLGVKAGSDSIPRHNHIVHFQETTKPKLAQYQYSKIVSKIRFRGLANMTVTTPPRNSRALIVDYKKKESHMHHLETQQRTTLNPPSNRDNRPRHINLHYIIRIK